MSRTADRAKQIRTRALVNKDPTAKIVRELKLENQRLKAVLARGNIDPQWLKTRLKGQPTNPQSNTFHFCHSLQVNKAVNHGLLVCPVDSQL